VAAKLDTSPPRGMRDILPDEVELRDATAAAILDVYRRYGFRRVETPALEDIRLLTRSEGGENEKLIFKVLKRGEKLAHAEMVRIDDLVDLGLRFDLTVPLARYYAENHAKLPQPLKSLQIGPVWRAERPQKGRYRQFTQCDIDILGVESAHAEVELILATLDALLTVGLTGLRVRLNDRRVLGALARHCGFAGERVGQVFVTLDKLDKIGVAGVRDELRGDGHPEAAVARMIDVLERLEREGPALEHVRALLGPDPDGVHGALHTIVRAVTAEARGRYTIEVDLSLVRGMGYYTGPIFEVAHSGYTSSIAGGGRYDRMIGKLLGREVPACGFSIGFERLIEILKERRGPRDGGERRIAVLVDGQDDIATLVALARELREQGQIVSLEPKRKNLGRQLEELATHGYGSYAVLRAPGALDVRPLARRTGKEEARS